MNQKDYLATASEINVLISLLAEIPQDNVIERMGLETRLKMMQTRIADVSVQALVYKAKLTFRGRPVFGSHGIAADFAAKATGYFTDAVAIVAVGLSEGLRSIGPIPDRDKHQLLITGTAIGSFGFEFELPNADKHGAQNDLFPQASKTEDALEKMQALFRLAAEGSDDQVAEIVEEIHPRAVGKVAEFLEYVVQQGALCGLEFKNQHFRYHDTAQLKSSVARLQDDNIKETSESFIGEFQGVLPASRSFEFNLSDQKGILKGKLAKEFEDPDLLNRDWLRIPAKIELKVIQVGQGRPRYTLMSPQSVSHRG